MSDPSTATDRPAAAGRWHGLNPVSILPVVTVAVAGIVLRWIVLAGADGRLGADESYAGLQAYEILDGDLPIVIRGAVYTAVLESYVFAPLTPLVGGHIVALKALFIVIWAVASVLVGVLAGRLLGRTAAIVAGALVWISPGALLAVSTLAYPGYALGMAATVGVAVLAVDLADGEPRRGFAAAFGLAAGLGFWIHPMFVAVTAPVVVFVFAIHRRRITEVWLPAIVGAIVGSGPLILWNAVNGWPSLTNQPDTPGTYTERFRAIVSDLFPRALGLKDAQLDWRFGAAIGLVLYLAVIALVTCGAVVMWRREGRRNKVVPITLATMVPLMAALPPLIFPDDGRYAVIAFPFVVVAVAAVVDELLAGRMATFRVTGPIAVTVGWFALLVAPAVVDAARSVDENPNATVEMVRDRLARAGIDTVNGSFWEVLPIDYVADGDLTAAVLPYYSVRFPDEQRAVEATDPARVAFVFALFDERPDQLWMAPDRYTREQIGEAVLYLPITLPTDGDG
ncbi:MAG TPA: hypothetical protein VNO51_16435 [Ilumatobacteraceae bacterium]|nr:hypothetical protein [Ilumatobacteraceae bacterium]